MEWRRGVAVAALTMGIGLVIGTVAPSAQAFPAPVTVKPGGAPVRVKMGSPQDRPGAPVDPLGLSQAQKAKMATITKGVQTQAQAIQKSKVSDQVKRQKLMALDKSYRSQMRALLTPAQRSKVDSAVARQMAMQKQASQKIANLKKTMTPQQKATVAAMDKDLAGRMRAIFANKNLNDQQKRQKLAALQLEARKKMDKILTAKQKAMLK